MIKHIFASQVHSAALDADDNIWMWGRRSRFVEGKRVEVSAIERIPLTNIRTFALSTFQLAALRHDGTAWTWSGPFERSQNADPRLDRAVQLPIPERVIDVGTLYHHGIALCESGTLYRWGAEWQKFAASPDEFRIAQLPEIQQIACGGNHCLIRLEHGQLLLWNEHTKGLPTALPEFHSIVDIVAGRGRFLAMREDGQVFGWWYRKLNQLSRVNTPGAIRMIPIKLPAPVAAFGVGLTYSLFVHTDGTVSMAGRLFYGLKDTDFVGSPKPVRIPGLKDIVQVACGWSHALFLSGDGTVYAMGHSGKHRSLTGKRRRGTAVPIKVEFPSEKNAR